MPRIDLVKKTPVSASARARQLEGMFDVPRKKESVIESSSTLRFHVRRKLARITLSFSHF
jgi:hypothetical protein